MIPIDYFYQQVLLYRKKLEQRVAKARLPPGDSSVSRTIRLDRLRAINSKCLILINECIKELESARRKDPKKGLKRNPRSVVAKWHRRIATKSSQLIKS